MAFLDKATIWGVKEETSYGNPEVLDYAVDSVEFISPTMDGAIDKLQREVTKNSLVSAKSLLGKETSTGTLPLEVTSTDDTGLLNGDILYKSAMGIRIPATAKEVLVPASAGVDTITVFDGNVYQIGQGLKILAGTATEYVTVTGISGNILSVAPDIKGGSVSEVTGLLSYRLAIPSTPVTSFNVEEYLESSASYLVYKYLGCVVSSMSIEFPMANILKTSFSVEGAGFSATTTTAKNGQCRDLTPHIAKNIVFNYAGKSYDINELTLNVENTIYSSEALTSSGIKNKIITAKPTIGGNFKVDYEGIELFNSYKDSTSGELVIQTTASNGKKFGGYAPKVILSNVSKSIDNSVYKDTATLEILSSDVCNPAVEDALSIWFE